jgi:molybdopterin-biosynthesis enzyme MoeA-like protein
MNIGLIILGDEILSGKRTDRQFAQVRQILARRGLQLAWAQYLGDDRRRITETLRATFGGGDVVFCTGGIGSTPDDHTRQAAAAALGVPLILHPEAFALIARRAREMNHPLTAEVQRMGEFPQGADIIPNPFNGIPGFSIREHYFVPGFPEMAQPMMEWVLDNKYEKFIGAQAIIEHALLISGVSESRITPLLEQIERDFPDVRTFSLPRLNPNRRHFGDIEVGVKGIRPTVDAALDKLRDGLLTLGAKLEHET